MRDTNDGAEPAGNSIAAQNLLRLGRLLNNPQWQHMARRLIESFSDSVNRYPAALPFMLTTWQDINSKQSQVVIAGERGAADTEALLRVVEGIFSRNRLLLLADYGENQAYLAKRLPFLETVVRLEGKATAYLCADFTCTMPTTDPAALKSRLEEE